MDKNHIEKYLSPEQLGNAEIYHRKDIAYDALGVDRKILRILRHMVLYGDGMTRSALATAIQIPRTSIMEQVKHLLKNGVLTSDGDNLLLTEQAVALYARVHSETEKVAFGRAQGYSGELVTIFERMGRLPVDSERARNLNFPLFSYR